MYKTRKSFVPHGESPFGIYGHKLPLLRPSPQRPQHRLPMDFDLDDEELLLAISSAAGAWRHGAVWSAAQTPMEVPATLRLRDPPPPTNAVPRSSRLSFPPRAHSDGHRGRWRQRRGGRRGRRRRGVRGGGQATPTVARPPARRAGVGRRVRGCVCSHAAQAAAASRWRPRQARHAATRTGDVIVGVVAAQARRRAARGALDAAHRQPRDPGAGAQGQPAGAHGAHHPHAGGRQRGQVGRPRRRHVRRAAG